MTLDDLERQNRGFLWIFLAIFAYESLYHLQGSATPLTPHAPMADVYYGPDGPSPNDMRFSKL